MKSLSILALLIALVSCQGHKHTSLAFKPNKPVKMTKKDLERYMQRDSQTAPTQLMKKVKTYQYR